MSIDQLLFDRFKHRTFRPGQRPIIEDVLVGKDVFAMLPTGTGKSICYQLPGYILEGTVIIVSPLISLMEDQVEQLKRNGEKRVCAFHSGIPIPMRKSILQSLSSYRFIYLSPETLQSDYLLRALKKSKISLFVVDEAHCISQWGHEFRTDYMKLSSVCEQVGRPPIIALTATATKQVREDIIDQLKLKEPALHIYSVDRPNIALRVEKVDTQTDKIDMLISSVRKLNGPGIIYTSSRNVAESITESLKSAGIGRVAYYHGGMENGDRLLIQKQFIYDELDVICCTNAFGMGINKPNIRYVIHFHFPAHIESYLQEIGRAGRDGEQSVALLLYHHDDDFIPARLVASEYPSDFEIDRFVQLYKEHSTTTEALKSLPLSSDTAERFLRYQSESINFDSSSDLQEWGMNVKDLIRSRKLEKQQRIHKMKRWIHTDTCRRALILDEFNEKYQSGPKQCCDVCGLNIPDNLESDPFVQPYNEYKWEEELRKTFHQVEKNA
ncbi:RecQ family ATP-dependent DNA helicase [Pseudalkalibacillus decolorationis]|uniref:RecQ family ATP-dependent DNA helicase n=1 Tax=Pseudalkalibacillus decolorationis TaxID=163879 RepID=UPI0021488CCB|nr:ATP-dependent DNA helicase RecQ [Pseudalkalibacillus decolorationis]